MAQKFLAPFKKIPHQVQNLPLFKKAHDLKYSKFRSELYGCRLSSTYGFPDNPSALTYDPTLKLLAIGTKKGELKILGASGVEFNAVHAACAEVCRIVFIPHEGRLITLTSDNKIHYWEYDENHQPPVWVQLKTLGLPGIDDERVTAMALSGDAATLFLGTEGGEVHKVHVKEWSLAEGTISTEMVAAGLEDADERKSLKFGTVVDINAHPASKDKRILIGYSEGLVAIYDLEAAVTQAAPEAPAPTEGEGEAAAPAAPAECPATKEGKATHLLVCEKELECTNWKGDGSEVTAAYSDGSFLAWSISEHHTGLVKNQDPPTTPYGPFPCKAITKLAMKTSSSGGHFTIFSGGMPKSTHGDRHTVSVMRDNEHVSFEMTSPVVEFVTLDAAAEATGEAVGDAHPHHGHDDMDQHAHRHADPHALIVLCEKELVAIDLASEKWPAFEVPYLSCINSSTVTALGLAEKVPEDVIATLECVKRKATHHHVSERDWPVKGGLDERKKTEEGEAECATKPPRDVLLTGHEDGTVSLWLLGYGDTFNRLATVNTGCLYDVEGAQSEHQKSGEEEAWPPFRRVGNYEPVTADPRLCVTRVQLVSGGENGPELIVSGQTGQASVWRVCAETRKVEVDVTKVLADLFTEEDHKKFVWQGYEEMKVKEGELEFHGGFQPDTLVQVIPPAAITAVALQPYWQLLGLATAHGLVVVDTLQKKMAHAHPTIQLDPDAEVPMPTSRGKMIKNQLRQSFKKLKKFKPRSKEAAKEEEKKSEEGAEKPAEGEAAAAAPAEGEATPAEEKKEEEAECEKKEEEAAAAPEEPAKQAEPLIFDAEDVGPSLVRCLLFAETFVSTPTELVASLWAGSNCGTAYIHKITLPTEAERSTVNVEVSLAKELQLQHAAPILGIAVVDAKQRAPLGMHAVAAPAAVAEPEKPAEKPAEEKPAEEGSAAAPGGDAATSTPAASTAEAAPGTPVAATLEHHEVVICSEEQVKIFTLPHLKPKHKYKVDKSTHGATAPGEGSGGVSATLPAGANAGANDSPKRNTATLTRGESKPLQQGRLHRIRSFAIQKYTHPDPAHAHTEFAAVLALADGAFYILSLPALRKQLTAYFSGEKESEIAMTTLGPSEVNVIVSLAGSGRVRLTGLTASEPSLFGAHCRVELAEGMRPKKEEPVVAVAEEVKPAKEEEKPEEKADEEVKKEEDVECKPTAEEEVKAAVEEVSAKLDSTHVDDSSVGEKSAQHIGDITMDSIKEYSTNNEEVTVKTYSSTKSETVVSDGEHVTTTVHETEVVDGKMTKDDLIKVTDGVDAHDSPAVTACGEGNDVVEEVQASCPGKIEEVETNCTGKIEEVETTCTGKIEEVETNCTGKVEEIETSCPGKVEEMEDNCAVKTEEVEANCAGES